eukprot:m.282876 g.282876  ORF g.282876 m.282876 type:complete len:1041 (+) comp40665_c0_seq11:87-3209(+)
MAASTTPSIRDQFENLKPFLYRELTVEENFLDLLVEKEVLDYDDVEENIQIDLPEPVKDLVRLLQTKVNEDNFPLFLAALREFRLEKVAWEFEQADLSVKKILEGTSTTLCNHCCRYGLEIIEDQMNSLRLIQIFLLEHRLENVKMASSLRFKPPISVTHECLELHERRKQEFLALVSDVQQFVKSENLQNLLTFSQAHTSDYFTREEIVRFSAASDWMEELYFKDAKSVVNGKPLLLVAGATSSGKSTLVNALLAEDILPTDFDVCTKVLCKVQYGHYKYAVVHPRGGEPSPPLPLGSEEDIENFAKYVKSSIPSEIRTALGVDSHLGYEIDIFWPSSFLKNVVIVDSPGVSVNDGFKKAVKQFKDSRACGFLFVLDANRAVEEAAAVGGLIKDNTELEEKGLSMARMALFILNKWDRVVDSVNKVEHSKKIIEEISVHWKGFRSDQLTHFDAEFAGYCSKLGHNDTGMDHLCELLKRKVPIGMTAQLLRGIRYPERSLGHVEEVLKGMLTVARMTTEKKAERLKGDWMNYQELIKEMCLDGQIGQFKQKILLDLFNLTQELLQYLPSNEGLQKARNLLQKADLENMEEEYSFENLLYDTIIESEAFKNFTKRMNGNVETVRKALNFLKETWNRLPEVDPCFVKSEIDNTLSILAKQRERESGFFRRLRRKMRRIMMFFTAKRDSVWLKYEDNLGMLCAGSHKSNDLLFRSLKLISEETIGPVAAVNREIPRECDLLAMKIVVKEDKMSSDIPDIERALGECRALQGSLSVLKMSLEFHDYDESEVIFTSQHLLGLSEGSQTFSKVKTPEPSEALLYTYNAEITKETTMLFQRHLEMLKLCRNADCLLRYYGSVRLSKKPLKFGFVFENIDMTLAECFFSQADFTSQWLKKAAGYAVDIASGVNYFHQEVRKLGGHADLRLENILIVKGVAKLGPCPIFNPDVADNSADIQSLGVILWEIWSRRRLSGYLRLIPADFTRRLFLCTLEPPPLAASYPGLPGRLQQKWQNVVDRCLGPIPALPDAASVLSKMKDILQMLAI